MPSRVPSSASGQSSTSSISHNDRHSNTTIGIWLLRILLTVILILFILPVAFLLAPWWIWMQPCEQSCPILMAGYFRIITWPLTISKNIRTYSHNDKFLDQFKY